MEYELSLYVLYLEDWRVLVCMHDKCQCGIVPEFVARHFREHHRHTYELPVRQAIERYAKTLDLSPPSEIEHQNQFSREIAGLKVWNGWRCNECLKCGPIETGGEVHCKKNHRWTNRQGERTYMKSSKTQY